MHEHTFPSAPGGTLERQRLGERLTGRLLCPDTPIFRANTLAVKRSLRSVPIAFASPLAHCKSVPTP